MTTSEAATLTRDPVNFEDEHTPLEEPAVVQAPRALSDGHRVNGLVEVKPLHQVLSRMRPSHANPVQSEAPLITTSGPAPEAQTNVSSIENIRLSA
jgi:hypothetical protein